MSKTPNRLAWVLSLIALLILFWGVGLYGLDFGVHWDETRAKLDSVQASLNTGVFMQSVMEPGGTNYNYGGVNYLLTWSGFVPEVAQYLIKGPLTREALLEAIGPIVYSPRIRLRVRAIYLFVSSLSIVWLFCLCVVLGRKYSEAFLAAAILGLSWEVGYHSRWMAPDGVMMQFAVLAFLCAALGLKRSSPAWFYGAAVAAGFAAGTKYPGALILPSLLVGAAYSQWRRVPSLLRVVKHVAGVAAVMGLTFAVTTPGAVLDPFRFFAQVQEQQEIYGSGWYGYSVRPGLQHIAEILKYFSLEVFSHYWQISALLAVAALIGVLVLVFEFRLLAFLVGAFCILYVLFFSRQAALLVRNTLVIVPFLTLAASRGITALADRLGPKVGRVLYALVGVALMMNVGWNVYAAEQINKRGNWEFALRNFEAYAEKSGRESFLVSQELMRELKKVPDRLPSNIVSDAGTSFTKVAFLQAEGPEWYWETWPANHWGLYDATFGAQEVNLEAYPTFVGNQRVIVVSRKQLDALPVKVNELITPLLTLSKSEVVAGSDSYMLKIKDKPREKIHIAYSLDGGHPGEFTVDLDPNGEKRMDVGPGTQKGSYRFLSFRRHSESMWHNVDETVVVK